MHTDLLIVGAGPFGLAMAAQAQALGIDHVLLGHPMSFWRKHMAKGLILRSGCNWHLDPMEQITIEQFLASRDQAPADVEPLTLDLYLQYADWFRRVKRIEAMPAHVTRLDQADDHFAATLDDGSAITARHVLLSLGFAPFANIPAELAALVPASKRTHTCDLKDPARFADQRVLIVGGRQSAFESAALIAEAGASTVHVCHRHDTPGFEKSDWTWVDPILERIADEPGWFRGLSDAERQTLNDRFWAEGRLKLEPWLGPRVHRKEIEIRPLTQLIGSERTNDGLRVRLERNGEEEVVEVDHVLFATGYKVDLHRIRLLESGNLIDRIECRDGFPVLDNALQTTVPGLFITSLPAGRDFGLFFAFTAAVRASARIVGRAVQSH